VNLVERAVAAGGKLAPIVVDKGLTAGTGLMNPSVFIDDDGDILVNLRHVNYTLYHSEAKQRFSSRWGPLAYLHPEKDMVLATENFLCRLDKDLNMINHTKVEMLNLHTPIWEFHGLEDCRLVQWGGEYFLVGVRRDTTTNGEGRMEYTKINIDKGSWTAKEEWRTRLPAPGANDSYCEKNWVPVNDKPHHFVKWTLPTELVKAEPFNTASTQTIFVKNQGNKPVQDQRGSSHFIPWGIGYISVSHEVDLFKNYLGQKDGRYRHRLMYWDANLELVSMTDAWTFLDGYVEFCVGAACLEGDLLLSFGFQDNAAFVLRVPTSTVTEMIEEGFKNVGK
jgi:hypothetical protein